MKKRFFSTGLVVLFLFFIVSVVQGESIIVQFKDGRTTSYEQSDLNSITTGSGRVIWKAPGGGMGGMGGGGGMQQGQGGQAGFNMSGSWHDPLQRELWNVSQRGNKLMVRLGNKGNFQGQVTGPSAVTVDFRNANCCTGTVVDNNTIKWSNGVTWTRR